MKKQSKRNKVKIQELRLPPLVSYPDAHMINKGLPQCAIFSIEELGRRIEQQLLEHPDFQPPCTTSDDPAYIVDYYIVEPDASGIYTAVIELLPGNGVQEICQNHNPKGRKPRQHSNAEIQISNNAFMKKVKKIDLVEAGLDNFDFATYGIEGLEEKLRQHLMKSATEGTE